MKYFFTKTQNNEGLKNSEWRHTKKGLRNTRSERYGKNHRIRKDPGRSIIEETVFTGRERVGFEKKKQVWGGDTEIIQAKFNKIKLSWWISDNVRTNLTVYGILKS